MQRNAIKSLRWPLAAILAATLLGGCRVYFSGSEPEGDATDSAVVHTPATDDPSYWTDERMESAQPLPMPTQK